MSYYNMKTQKKYGEYWHSKQNNMVSIVREKHAVRGKVQPVYTTEAVLRKLFSTVI